MKKIKNKKVILLNKVPDEVKLHLGCGSNYMQGYINIDQLKDQSDKSESRTVDLDADFTKLSFPSNSVSEIRLHHVFEHFHRYQVTALLLTWNNWLINNGRLIIETPDFLESAKRYILNNYLQKIFKQRKKYGYQLLRHLYGSKEADWGNHFEGWDSNTLSRLLKVFGFEIDNISYARGKFPSVIINVIKTRNFRKGILLKLSKKFLSSYVINSFELNVWLTKVKEYNDLLARGLIAVKYGKNK